MFLPLFAELKRRRVFRALVGYGIAAFAVLQIIEPVMHGLHWPEAVLSYVVVALAAGFPVVVSLAWIFDVSAGRIERTAPSATAGGLRGMRLVLLLVAIGLVAAAPGTIWYFVVRGIGKSARPPEGSGKTTPSVAVLPFADMSPGKDQEYFSDGIAEEIMNALAHVEGLRVIGRTSSFSFKGKNADLRTIGQELGVGTVLEGSVRKAGQKVRVTTQLVNTADGAHLWSEAYDRNLSDVFAVQDEIAQAVVAALRLKLLPGQTPATKERRTASPEVYNQYLLGRQFYSRSTADGGRRATKAFEKALALDPGYAPAWAGLAQATFYVFGLGGGTAAEVAAAQERALAAAEKAVALAPDLADGYSARGKMRIAIRHDWAGGRADIEHALSLNPSDVITVRIFANDVLLPVGQLSQAIAVARKATGLDPLDTASWTILGLALYYGAQIEPAREALARALEINPENDWAGLHLGIVDLLDGKPARALARHERLSTEWTRLTGVALAQHDLGHPKQSQEALDALLAGHAADSPYQVAEVYARRGENDRSLEWLDRSYTQRDPGLRYVKCDPLLRSLHGDQRFPAFLRKMNLPLD